VRGLWSTAAVRMNVEVASSQSMHDEVALHLEQAY
jgi:hypothetical protein